MSQDTRPDSRLFRGFVALVLAGVTWFMLAVGFGWPLTQTAIASAVVAVAAYFIPRAVLWLIEEVDW